MFAIYDIGGLRFRDTLEKLHQVQKTTATAGSAFHHNVNQDDSSSDSNNTSNQSKLAQSQHAHKAYQDTLNLNQREPLVHAHQLMSSPVQAISMEMNIAMARLNFQQHKFKQMPVINQQKNLVGMLSLEALLQYIVAYTAGAKSLQGKRVKDVMTVPVIAADPISDIRHVACLMLEYELHGVPITNQQDELIGLLSRSDILRAVTNTPPLNIWS